MIRAVLWDVGGPINTEVEHERLIDGDILSALADEGVDVDSETYAIAARYAVDCYAPDAYKALIWRLCDEDQELAMRVHKRMHDLAAGRRTFELRDGISDVLAVLHQRGVKLGLVANQPESTIQELNDHGVGKYFQHQAFSGTLGFRKPDVRLFLAACDALEVQPDECVMVGDRVDNDIAPAATLGMYTVLLRTGRHREQQPRSWDEIPDVTVNNVDELRKALFVLLNGAS